MTAFRKLRESIEYVSISSGMALAMSCFMVLGLLARNHPGSTIVGIIGGVSVLCLVMALGLGEMSSRFPSAPGIRTYTKRAFGDRTSLFLTYQYLLAVPLVGAIELKTFVDAVAPGGSSSLQAAVAVGVMLVLGLANLRGKDFPRSLQVVLWGLLVLGLFGMAYAGIRSGSATPAPRGGSTDSVEQLGTSLALAFFLFVGFEWVASSAESEEAARSLVPYSMLASILLLAVLYTTFALALQVVLPADVLEHASTPHVAIGRALYRDSGAAAMQALSLAALFTTLNAGLMGGSRLLYGLARERSLPVAAVRRLAWLNDQGVPSRCVVLICALTLAAVVVIVAVGDATRAAQASAALYCFVYGGLAFAPVRLRKTASMPAPFRNPVPSVVYVVISGIMTALGIVTFVQSSEHRWLSTVSLLLLTGAVGGTASRVVQQRKRVAAQSG